METCDVAIIGGGLAGLSLAARLAEPRFKNWRVRVLEPRTEYVRDRTWCYWAKHAANDSHERAPLHPFLASVAMCWPQWEVMYRADNASEYEAAVRTGRYSYEMIPADRFYTQTERLISSSSHVKLLKGVTVSETVVRPGGVEIKTDDGSLNAALVFDSRPTAKLSSAAWIQRFQGFELEADEPVFELHRATLMDFSVSSAADSEAGRVHFIYVLPLSDRRALIEDTWFVSVSDACNDVDYQSQIKHYLKRRYGLENYRVVHREEGALPMDPALRPSALTSRIVKIGAGGGMARASSGYAFFETQRACDAIADKLMAQFPVLGEFSLPRWRGDISYWMDAVFLRVLAQRPALAPKIFFDLFSTVPPDALARFLSGVATPFDVAKVIAACPKIPFLKAAFFRS